MKVGVIGLGNLGKAVAYRLQRMGCKVAVYNRSKEKYESAELLKVNKIENIETLIRKNYFIILCLSGEEAVVEVFEVLESLPAELLESKKVLDLATCRPDFSDNLVKRSMRSGFTYAVCPVSGGAQGARDGSLASILYSEGSVPDFQNVLSKFSNKITVARSPRETQILKILNNLAESINLLGAIETLTAGQKLGLSISDMSAVFKTCRGRSAYMDVALDYFLDQKSTEVSLGVRVKDLRLSNKLLEAEGLSAKLLLAKDVSAIYEELLEIFSFNYDQCGYKEFLGLQENGK